MILLFDSNETVFTSNGLGALQEATYCQVTQERNGAFEVELQYPITGIRYADLINRRILLIKPDPYSDPQPFRIYQITKPISGVVSVYAQHLAYDLAGVPVSPFTANSVQSALQGLKSNSVVSNGFNFWTDKTTTASFSVSVPVSCWSLLGGNEGSILDVYGGEYEFDATTIKLWDERGQDNGVTIRYGKNLTDLKQEENISNLFTGIYPYWVGSDQSLVALPEKIVNAQGTYNFQRITPVDFSGDFDSAPSENALRAKAESYITTNRIGVPTVSIDVSFQPLDQTEEYKDFALLEKVSLCDTVTVEYSDLGVSAKAKCVKTVYDALKDRYVSIEIGDAKSNMADIIADQSKEIEYFPESSAFKNAIFSATNLITGNRGGYVVLHDTTGDGQPDEILIMNTPDIATAQKVWRWNSSGLGYSGTGYNGPYNTAITQDGAIVADFITAGSLNAGIITTGMLTSKQGNFTIDLSSGILTTEASVVFLASNYTQDDINRVQNIILKAAVPTEEDYNKYDLFSDGIITVTDLINIQQMVNTGQNLKLVWKVTITPHNRSSIFQASCDKYWNGVYSSTSYPIQIGAGYLKTPGMLFAGEEVTWKTLNVDGNTIRYLGGNET